jgi:hypothetical protein
MFLVSEDVALACEDTGLFLSRFENEQGRKGLSATWSYPELEMPQSLGTD